MGFSLLGVGPAPWLSEDQSAGPRRRGSWARVEEHHRGAAPSPPSSCRRRRCERWPVRAGIRTRCA
ncbi:hypothetical protein DDK07_14500 [Mycobacteroides abscessus]|nr:hypothetical protein DDK07_14500 [Mycobacteroides abscessus]RIR77503.1 hypothetical protein D2E68_09985 [Mycobacteroides abscessus]